MTGGGWTGTAGGMGWRAAGTTGGIRGGAAGIAGCPIRCCSCNT